MRILLWLLLLAGLSNCATAQDGRQRTEDKAAIEATGLQLAQTQLDAYNQRDLEAFLAPYADDIRIYRYPNTLIAEGKEAMRRMYAQMFERYPNLQCQLISRMVMGDTVIDREKVYLDEGEYMHAIAIYKVGGDRIKEVRFVQE